MHIASLGNSIYNALKNDVKAQAVIRKEYSALALSLATNPDASSRITSATVNGQSFTAQASMTNAQRLKLLSWVCKCFDLQATISTTAVTDFNS